MTAIEVVEFEISVTAIEKFWRHGIRIDQVRAVLEHRWILTHNRAERAAPFVLLGWDHQGRCLAIPIVPTHDPDVWRPVTAWCCKRSEATKLRQGRGIMEGPIGYEALQQPLDDEERELMDPETWDWDSMQVGAPVANPRMSFVFGFSREELQLLSDVAYGQGITPIAYIKRVALAAARDGVQVESLDQPAAASAR